MGGQKERGEKVRRQRKQGGRQVLLAQILFSAIPTPSL